MATVWGRGGLGEEEEEGRFGGDGGAWPGRGREGGFARGGGRLEVCGEAGAKSSVLGVQSAHRTGLVVPRERHRLFQRPWIGYASIPLLL